MTIMAEFANNVGCATPLFTSTQSIYADAMGHGLATMTLYRRSITSDDRASERVEE